MVKGKHKESGMTMVELLVSIGIIMILGSLIYAAISNVTAQSKSVACLANMRSYGQAVLLYIADNGGVLPNRTPEVDDDSKPLARFGNWVTPYLDVPLKDFRCPLATAEEKKTDSGFCYSGNVALTETYWTLKNIPAPHSRVVLASEMYSPLMGFWVQGHFNRTIWGNNNGGANPDDEGSARRPQYHGDSKNRGLNMFMLDGSAKLVKSVGNDWANPPTYGDATNGGYFYTTPQFDRMMRGKMIFD